MLYERKRQGSELQSKIWYVLSLGLLALLTVYFLKGFYHLTVDPVGASDFAHRWRSLQYLYQGHYPYFIRTYSPKFDPAIGEATYGGYFPWSFFSLAGLIPPIPLAPARAYFAVVNVLALLILSAFVYRSFDPYGPRERAFAVISVLAISTHCTTLGLGQLGIVVNALLVLCFQCLKSGRLTWAGIFCGMALLKPNISGLYFLLLLTPKRYRAAMVTVSYLSLTSLFVAVATKTNVLKAILTPLDGLSSYADSGSFIIEFLSNTGIPIELAIFALMLASGAGCLFLLSKAGSMPLIYQFAMLSVAGRLGMYHRSYDNVMLVFLYIAFLHCLFTCPNRLNIGVFYLLGLSLWLPANWFDAPLMGVAQSVVWVGALVFLLYGHFCQAQGSKAIASPSQTT